MNQATAPRHWRDYRLLALLGAFYILVDSIGDQDWIATVSGGLATLVVSGMAYVDRRLRKQAEAAE